MKIEQKEINGVTWTIIGEHAEAEGPDTAKPSPDELPVSRAKYGATDTQIEYFLRPGEDTWVMKSPFEKRERDLPTSIGSRTMPLNVGTEAYLRMGDGDRLVIEFDGVEWEVVTTDDGLELRSSEST